MGGPWQSCPMAVTPRLTGPPTSSNGASSFHARWDMADVPLRAVSAVLEIVSGPATPSLYFWALQASFRQGGQRRGAGHLGLQHHPSYPGSGAVNWGGYHDPSSGGGVLDGTGSALVSTLGNANTFDYPWSAGRRYRLEIALAAPGRWRGAVTDLANGTVTVVRELFVDADHLVHPMIWSEVFAECDAAPVDIRWSSLAAASVDGRFIEPTAVTLSYQREDDGGCSNTSTSVDDGWLIQRTATERVNGHGARLPW